MAEKTIDTKQEESTDEKKVYVPPILIVYGKLSDLTAGAGGSKNENFPVTAKRKT